MKLKTLSGIVASLVLMVASVGHASPITHSEHFEGGKDVRGNPKEISLFEFDPAMDTLSDLSVTLNFAGRGNGQGWMGKNISLWLGGHSIATSETSESVTFNLAALALPRDSAALKLKWSNGLGNILLMSYEISYATPAGYQPTVPPVAGGPEDAQAVPAPSTLALLSLGLFGTAFLGRRREKKDVTQ